MEGRGKKGGGAFFDQGKSSYVWDTVQVFFCLNSQAQVFGVGELEEVANRDNGGLAGEEGLRFTRCAYREERIVSLVGWSTMVESGLGIYI